MTTTKSIAIFFTILVSGILGAASISITSEYGWTVFLLIPFLIGFLPPFIVSLRQKISIRESYGLSFLTLGISLIALLIFAVEGLICIVMSLPILLPAVWLGSYIGFLISDKRWMNKTNSTIAVFILCFVSMGFDVINESENLIPVKTSVIVNAPIEQVWENVVAFDKIDEPTDWIFKTGISCPTDATIKGTGVGAIRHCNFTTGSFVEPITTWNEPALLQFDVIEQPIPMNEFNPFWDIHPRHLEGYFVSKKGQFQLTSLLNNQTKLEGTTWYSLDILPQPYWKLWSDFIIHRIHVRVLNHIKKETEK